MSIFRRIKDLLKLLFVSRAARLNFTLLGGVLINLAYIAGNIASALIYHSAWAATVSAYHLMLIIIRLYLLSARRPSSGGDIELILLRVGILLLFLDLACALIMAYTIGRGSFVSYSGFILFAFLLYAVYSLTSSALAIKRHANDNDHLHFAARSISLSTSLMSVFNLQYSVLSLFGADSRLMVRAILSGGIAVFFVILFLSLRLIKKQALVLKSSKK